MANLSVPMHEAMSEALGTGNSTFPNFDGNITMDSNFALLLVSLLLAVLWVVYITYYNSRLLGYILTRLINKFYFQDENFKIGSCTLNAISGKIMFRDIVYITSDYTLRVQDGYLIFRWWRSYIPKDVSEDLSHSDTRLSIVLNGFELHFYNRCDLYNELEKTFGLEPYIKQHNDEDSKDRDKAMNDANEKRRRAQDAVRSEAAMARTWRDLIPVIKIDVYTGRVVFGNRLIPTTLSIGVEEAHLVYSTKPPASSLDNLMHFVKAKAENCKVILAPSPNYTAMVDEPPRYMGEGFVVMSSNYIEVYFYMDEPGLVPEQTVLLQLANGDVVESALPIWGVDIKCGKGTDFSYGPWADRQRDNLFKFFFPPSYKTLEVTPQPKPGDRRQVQSFDIRLSTLNEATIDILFTKNKETNAVHINIGAGSYMEVTLPWIILSDGYTTKITGQLLHLEATTSLQYRSLVESETLEYTIKCHYPLVWNHHQSWSLSLTGCKATAHIVYTHIDFFQDLTNDWSTKSRPDILHFVPYTWKISFLLKECEVVTNSNQCNWIDCSSTNQENSHVAFCGDLLDVSFDLPFTNFLPDIIPLKIWIQGEAVDMSLYLPEVNTSRLLLLSIDKNMKLVPCRLKSSKWRRKCVKSQGWVDCWSVPIIALSIRYNYHPSPPLGPEPQADITTPEKEEILLSPMRIPRMRKQPQMNWAMDSSNFDRTTLTPDKVNVELEVGPSILLAYGTIITSFLNLIENLFGEDQKFTDMQKAPNLDAFSWSNETNTKINDRSSINQNDISLDDTSDTSKGPFDPRRYRPMEVSVSIIIHDIQAHLVKNCSENEPPCPVVLIERFGFEMDKKFRETKLQILLSPSILVSSNSLSRLNPNNTGILQQGHLMLSSFQLRGHGYFSDTNRSVDEETVEYSWMMELQIGQLTGRLTLPQLYQIISSLETFMLLISDNENELIRPNSVKLCQHGLNNILCPETDSSLKYRCPASNDIKYRMIRVAIDLIDIYVADTNTTMQTWISPIRLSFCNLHGPGFGTGTTALLPNIKLALYSQTNIQNSHNSSSNASNNSQNKPPETENWVGVGSMSLGPLLIESASSLPQSPRNLHLVQQKFLKLHDEKSKRLWFLWPNETRSSLCGCTGGCSFFGTNRNGANFFKPSPSDINDGINVAMFNVIETLGEYGYGQSILHPGQLVFHTPPYSNLNVCLQPTNGATLIPSPLPQSVNKSPLSGERKSLTRRFSYTSITKGSNNVLVSSTKSDVPYARLVDATIPLGNSKIDSDSKLNRSILNVPQMESSVSDSKLALSCVLKDNANGSNKKSKHPENEGITTPKVPKRSVAVSESHYSLNSQIPHEETVAQAVQRTTSITSENPSEAFFSADEDMFPSRSSSLKHSYGSRRSNQKDKSSFGIHDITNEKWTNSRSPKSDIIDAPDTMSNLSTGVQPDSESGSVSSNSFISAISSQEDMTLVNLHMQTNKPIIESPLLMASYMQNLPHYKCTNWAHCSLPVGSDVFTLPLFKRTESGDLVYVGQKYLPSFDPSGKVNILKLITKKDCHINQNQHGPFSNLTPHFNSQIKAHPYPQAWWDLQQNVQDNQENTTDKSSTSTATTTSDSKTGLVIKFRGEIDIMMTPLVLESTQKFVESLTPVLANIHPITVINHLRLRCISSVESNNVLKQKQHVLNWLPQMQARSQSNVINVKDDKCKLATIPHSNVYEETICDQLQATMIVPKVNFIFVQSSVVEDMISFSALDNIQDLTCVSLFGISVENITAKYKSSRKILESVQLYYRPTLKALGSKKPFGIMKGPRALISTATGSSRKKGQEKGEPVYIETSQQQCEDITVALNIGKVHGQLRRIRNESSQLKDVTITGIPCQHSKVAFKFVKVDAASDISHSQNGSGEGQKENSIGYIMFESGLENITIKVSKHAQSTKPKDEKKIIKPDIDSCRDSVKSAEELKPEKEKSSKSHRTSGLEDFFKKRESSSKPSTPNLGTAQPPPVPPPEPSTPGPEEPSNDSCTTIVPLKDNGNTSSCAIDLKVVWFNFAAPPRTPITKKIDYTRLDWNLVSTASPGISAWLNPSNRLGIRVVALYRAHARRLAATAASLMAAALDLAPHHAPPKSRYGRHTPMAKQLREEPSLQLCAVLLRYALQADAAAVQADLAERHLPSLSTLRQGVIVLSRQWKNILYTPLLLEHNYKSKVMKPLNVTFALPEILEDSVEGWQEYQIDNEALDENCLLLSMDIDKLNMPESVKGAGGSRGASGRASLVLPSLPFTRKTFHDDAINYGTLKEDLPTVGSNPSLYSTHGSEEDIKNDRAREDLYQWMAKQEPIKMEQKTKKQMIPSKMYPLAMAAAMPACSLYPVQGSLMLLDAHLVFQPFLTALGVSPQQVAQGESKSRSGNGEGSGTSPALESLGSKLSLLAWVDTFRIDIVVGDLGPRHQRHTAKGKANIPNIDIPSETPAFLCEKVSFDVDLKKVADMAVDDLIQRQNVLYISRGQLKKHISTMVNFNVSIRFISQQVNMPLLRLLHQISNMYQHVKDTQVELRSQTKTSHHRNKHRSSISDFRDNLVSVTSLEKESQYGGLGQPWESERGVSVASASGGSERASVASATPPHRPPAPVVPTHTAPPPALVIHPSPAPLPATVPRTRPQSFAQKLRSTGKTVKGKLAAGYSSLNEGAHTPMLSSSVGPSVDTGVGVGGAGSAGAGDAPDGSLAPRCWRTLYHLLDLYANMPDSETITHRFSVTTEIPEQYRHSQGGQAGQTAQGGRARPSSREQNTSNSSASAAPVPIVVVGVARIHRTRLLASLSALKLEAELTSLQASVSASRTRQRQLSGTLGRATIVLLEGVAPHQQTVVRVSVGKSQALYSWECSGGGGGNAGSGRRTALGSVGAVRVDLPQHPVALHGLMTRSSRHLSTTLQELGVTRTSSRLSRGGGTGPGAPGAGVEEEVGAGSPPPAPRPPLVPVSRTARRLDSLLDPLNLQFSIVLQSLSITAALLPSLQAQYKMEHVRAAGVTGAKPHLTADLPHHSLSFVTKLQVTEANIPAAAIVCLPGVAVRAAFVDEDAGAGLGQGAGLGRGTDEEVVVRAGRYLAATADIAHFDHTLSTDLLNHLVFVQKVFMKEVNEVVQKVYGSEKPVPLWNGEEASSSALNRILFSLVIRIKRIQLTATTPSNSAVRLETGQVELELSNRVQTLSRSATAPVSDKLFVRAQVDVNLSLGQLIRNAMFEEAEPEFQQYAFFNTRISMRNAFQDEITGDEDKEVVLIKLKRPLIYVQPVAVDKAILVWLNYKTAYEYWNEKRLSLNNEVLTATQQIIEKVQQQSQNASAHLSMLFLQLDVDDIGICLPLNQPPLTNCWAGGRPAYEVESRGAVVVTLESTSISACSSGALVSKGRFVGLCLRFADDFETSLDDWKPDPQDPSYNVCCVSEGTYEVCSRTTASKHNENAKWFLNVSWQMEGVDIHLDVNVGKQLSALGHTLTMLTGFEEEDPLKMDYESDLDDEADNSKDSQESIILRRKFTDHLPAFVFDTTIDAKKRSKLIEKEMNEQAKIINDLRTLGASHSTIEYEMKRLHDLEALVFKDFRRDMIQKFRRQSVRASSITKGKLGLGSSRSRSFVSAPPLPPLPALPALPALSPLPPDHAAEPRHHFDSVVEPSLVMTAGTIGGSGETLLLSDEDNRLADIIEGASWSSMESEPLTAGPSRSASLRGHSGAGGGSGVAGVSAGRAGGAHSVGVQRQASLPSGGHAHSALWPPENDVQLRRRTSHATSATEASSESKQSKSKTTEPNIDFELDVKVHINSGQCVLHTKEPSRDDDIKMSGSRMRVGRSTSGGLCCDAAGASPPGARRKHAHTHTHTHAHTHARHPALDSTIFRVPGLHLKVHYESKTLPDEATSPQSVPLVPPLNQSVGARKVGTKKAALFAWITVQSIPEETIISPHILEFLEQTLEPIPTKTSFSTPTPEVETGSRSAYGEGASYGQYVYASFPVDVIVHFHMQPSAYRFSCLPASRVECLLQLPTLQIVFSSKRAQDEEMAEPAVAMGGLSVTGGLADFSVYIFHPYGGKKSSIKEAQWSPLSDTERKDSLSINVEFVKFHLSRSRKLDFQSDQDQSKATVRFSTIIDVGSAWFKYDMRRLTEILAFPRAWYRRSIVRRVFLGDLSVNRPDHAGSPSNVPVSPVLPQREKAKPVEQQKSKESSMSTGASGAAWETLVLFAVNFTKLNVHMNMGNVMGNVSWLSRDFKCAGRLSIGSTGHRNMLLSVALDGSSLDARAGIVGGAISLSHIHTYVHIEEEPGCNPAHVCGVQLAALELRLEYMGTPVLLARVSALRAALRDQWLARHKHVHHHHHPPTARPATILIHGTLSWNQLQILMSRSTTPDLLKMQMKLEEFFTQQFKSSKRVFSSLHPNYGTTRRDRKEPTSSSSASGVGGSGTDSQQQQLHHTELRHHRHWQRVLRLVSGVQLSTLPTPLPANGTVLGGTMELQGNNVSLACFHGTSFKAKSWALFSLKEPSISFATEAQQIESEEGHGSMEVHVVQSLTAGLGCGTGVSAGSGAGGAGHQSMATVCRMTRSLLFPPQLKTLREWFLYAFANSEIDAIELFPSLEPSGAGGGPGHTGSAERDRGGERGGGAVAGGGGSGKTSDNKHVREVIFALPSLQLHVRTHHLQASQPPTENDEKPVVECSFITEFEDHIFVSVDAEAFLFLHDLISSYIKEKDRLTTSRGPWGESSTSNTQGASASAGGDATQQKTAEAGGSGGVQDYRDYRCVTWHLEPTVRLLSWAGKSIEPYGVDYILQKLGFSHARTTIPKWLQRGTLDPLDKLLALVLLRLVGLVPTHQAP